MVNGSNYLDGDPMDRWRLLKFETHNAYMNMAIDEAIMDARTRMLVPNTLRFYRWNPSAVSIGYFQKLETEVYLENCKKQNVDVVRRISGGGAVYHDACGEITYSVVADKESLKADDYLDFYTKIYAGIVEALKILGLEADFQKGDAKNCPNLTVKNKKISGSAQYHRGGIILQHGTILLDVNLEKMFTLLRVPWAKTCMEVVEIAKNRITSIKAELGKEIPIDIVHDALIDGFQRALNVSFKEEILTSYEKALAKKLYEEKYSRTEWNFTGKTSMK
jgi:lipoate-protein ligase A